MQIDEFESQFKRAIHDVFHYQEPPLRRIVLLCNEPHESSLLIENALKELIPHWDTVEDFDVVGGSDFNSVRQAMYTLAQAQADLIVIERSLKTNNDDLVYGLSNYVDAVTQARPEPVLLLPALDAEGFHKHLQHTTDILVSTNRLAGSNALINWGARFSVSGSKLRLIHVEDQTVFNRYMSVIEMIPQIDSDTARSQILQTLLALPREYADHVRRKLDSTGHPLDVAADIRLGHTLTELQQIIEAHPIRMLVMNTEVEGQLAMSGQAYVTAVEFKELPMLLL